MITEERGEGDCEAPVSPRSSSHRRHIWSDALLAMVGLLRARDVEHSVEVECVDVFNYIKL